MTREFKTRLYEYLLSHDDGSEEAKGLINKMKYEQYYSDCPTHSVGTDDLDEYFDQETLRNKLGKGKDEPYTIEDCDRVADAIADLICDEYAETLDYAINHEL